MYNLTRSFVFPFCSSSLILGSMALNLPSDHWPPTWTLYSDSYVSYPYECESHLRLGNNPELLIREVDQVLQIVRPSIIYLPKLM